MVNRARHRAHAKLKAVQQLLPALADPPILFAHRGASGYAPENTIEAFRLGLKLGATGIESDIWLTADGEVVCDHDGTVRVGKLRRRPIGEMARRELPAHIPTLAEVIDACGTDFDVSLDLKDPRSGQAAIAAVREVAPEMVARLWLCHPSLAVIEALRPFDADVRLVDSCRLASISEGPERRAAYLATHGIDCINMPIMDWNGGLIALFHRFGRFAFQWGTHHEHQLDAALRMGSDAVYSDYPDRMVDAMIRLNG